MIRDSASYYIKIWLIKFFHVCALMRTEYQNVHLVHVGCPNFSVTTPFTISFQSDPLVAKMSYKNCVINFLKFRQKCH